MFSSSLIGSFSHDPCFTLTVVLLTKSYPVLLIKSGKLVASLVSLTAVLDSLES